MNTRGVLSLGKFNRNTAYIKYTAALIISLSILLGGVAGRRVNEVGDSRAANGAIGVTSPSIASITTIDPKGQPDPDDDDDGPQVRIA